MANLTRIKHCPSPTILRQAVESRYVVYLEDAERRHCPVQRSSTDDPARAEWIAAVLRRLEQREKH